MFYYNDVCSLQTSKHIFSLEEKSIYLYIITFMLVVVMIYFNYVFKANLIISLMSISNIMILIIIILKTCKLKMMISTLMNAFLCPTVIHLGICLNFFVFISIKLFIVVLNG